MLSTALSLLSFKFDAKLFTISVALLTNTFCVVLLKSIAASELIFTYGICVLISYLSSLFNSLASTVNIISLSATLLLICSELYPFKIILFLNILLKSFFNSSVASIFPVGSVTELFACATFTVVTLADFLLLVLFLPITM